MCDADNNDSLMSVKLSGRLLYLDPAPCTLYLVTCDTSPCTLYLVTCDTSPCTLYLVTCDTGCSFHSSLSHLTPHTMRLSTSQSTAHHTTPHHCIRALHHTPSPPYYTLHTIVFSVRTVRMHHVLSIGLLHPTHYIEHSLFTLQQVCSHFLRPAPSTVFTTRTYVVLATPYIVFT